MILTTPIWGLFVILMLTLDMVYLKTKFEDSSFSRSRDMKEDVERKIAEIWGDLGHSRSSAMSPFDRAHTTSYAPFIQTVRLSCTILEIASCRKSQIFPSPRVFGARRGRPRWNINKTFDVRKLESLRSRVVLLA